MMKRVSLIAALLLTVGVTESAPVKFKRTTAEGDPAADLVVDTENRTLVWAGNQKYAIHAMNDRYISAYLKSQSAVGGEVWVFNRVTGEYLRASAYIGWDSPEVIKRNDPGKLTATTFRGKCSRPLL
jgi:hypothetical protein